MSEMIRKQFYIHKRHQLLLRKLAQARGVSEAEIVRQAIEHEAAGAERSYLAANRAAWDSVLLAVKDRRTLGEQATPYHWDRQDAYDERERRLESTSR